MENKELSIIIPVYNVEDYIEKCIDSVLQIEHINYEIIVVNDGTKDNSGSICEAYFNKYPEIINYIVQENQGLSGARNTGIKSALGEYIFFLDSDDYIDASKLDAVFSEIKKVKPDVAYFGAYIEGEKETREYCSFVSDAGLYNTNAFLKKELLNRNLPAAACFGIYKKSIIVDNELYFFPKILHEDERWSPLYLLHTSTIFVSRQKLYHYLQREGSIMHKKDRTQNGIDIVQTAVYLEKEIQAIEDVELKEVFDNRLAMLYMKGTVVGRLYRCSYRQYINRFFPIKHAFTLFDRIKATIYMISPFFYCIVAKFIKG